jgi:hypothetical protein
MNLIGKILTVFIFIMSIVFMTFAMMVFATHRNWKEYADNPTAAAGKPLGLKQQLEQIQAKRKEAEDLLQRLQNDLAQEQAARQRTLAALQVRVTNAEQLLTTKERELATLSAQHSSVAETAKMAQERLATLEKATQEVRDELRTAQQDRDKSFLAVVDLTDKLNQLESLRQILDERNKEAAFQISEMKMVLDSHGLRADERVSHIPPKVEGVVLEVSGKDLIEISIGADDGLKVGHSLDVYRNNTYLGRLVIRRTDPDRAVGQMIKELQRGQIKRGDRVTTKFS